jgi:L-alanine-DL-glutamate epimerase-like enolase superfamily enzyme
MSAIARIDSGLYRIPLPVMPTDSTHGAMAAFELVTVRVFDKDGAEGVGYTYTVSTGGAAVHALIARYLKPLLERKDASLIEARRREMWWALHYGGRVPTLLGPLPNSPLPSAHR